MAVVLAAAVAESDDVVTGVVTVVVDVVDADEDDEGGTGCGGGGGDGFSLVVGVGQSTILMYSIRLWNVLLFKLFSYSASKNSQ